MPNLLQFTPAGSDEDPLAPVERRLRLRTLVLLRWIAVAGQTAAVLFTTILLGFEFPLPAAFGVIAASAWLNTFLSIAQPGQRILSHPEAAGQIAFDTLQLTLLMGLTGGVANPFVVMLAAPVVIAFSALRARYALAIATLAGVGTGIIARWHAPLPWNPATPFEPPTLYVWGLWTAFVAAAGFMSVFVWRAASDGRRMSRALAATHYVLAREQRLSALGGLAAAAAHELGTPLGTIQVTAKEMARVAPPGSDLQEDAKLLVSQAERCREILSQLSRRGEEGDAVHSELSLPFLLDEVVDPIRGTDPQIEVNVEPARSHADRSPPVVRRVPEVLYAISNYVANAARHADELVTVTGRWTEHWIEVEIIDDGPGFPPDILGKLGEPYVHGDDVGADPRGGLGLGFFIAKTFVERTGGQVAFGNRPLPDTGARVRARWPRSSLTTDAATN